MNDCHFKYKQIFRKNKMIKTHKLNLISKVWLSFNNTQFVILIIPYFHIWIGTNVSHMIYFQHLSTHACNKQSSLDLHYYPTNGMTPKSSFNYIPSMYEFKLMHSNYDTHNNIPWNYYIIGQQHTKISFYFKCLTQRVWLLCKDKITTYTFST
jgi:hypothetical protein